MATSRDWADAYLAQAKADLEGARLVGAAEPSDFAMLMQMVFEKLAKAALLRSGAVTLGWAEGTHRAATHMVRRRKRPTRKPALGRARLASCANTDTLIQWFARAVTASSEAEVFASGESP